MLALCIKKILKVAEVAPAPTKQSVFGTVSR